MISMLFDGMGIYVINDDTLDKADSSVQNEKWVSCPASFYVFLSGGWGFGFK